jgi:probable H4MPT-linked C1 transfer pathway protein
LDIGGANLKAADGSGFAHWHPFALWKESAQLTQQLRTLIAQSPRHDHLAVTMTGELADCFGSKTEGVSFILDAVRKASDGRHTRVYLTSGQMVTPQVAMRRPLEAAAANWHALARFAGRFVPEGFALLIDVGSTTTDVIPLVAGQPAAEGLDDTSRLMSRELIYSGVERTPLCAVASELPYRGAMCPLAREHFATTRDAYVILGDLPEDSLSLDTADGRSATRVGARTRLGRMICADNQRFNHRDAVAIARYVAEVQRDLLFEGIGNVIGRRGKPLTAVVVSGEGEFLAVRAVQQLDPVPRLISVSQRLGEGISRCAPAHAVAVLAREAALG